MLGQTENAFYQGIDTDRLSAADPRGWDDPLTITVSGVVVDADEAATHPGVINHGASGGEYSGVAVTQVVANVGDDSSDDAEIELTTITGPVNEEFGISTAFAIDSVAMTSDVDLDGNADGLVQLEASDLSSLIPGQLVIFAEGTNDTLQTTIISVDDGLDQIVVSGAVTADPSDTDGVLAIVAGFQVRLGSQPLATVLIDFTSDDFGEGFPTPATLAFDSSNWDSYQVVSVVGEDDDVGGRDLSGRKGLLDGSGAAHGLGSGPEAPDEREAGHPIQVRPTRPSRSPCSSACGRPSPPPRGRRPPRTSPPTRPARPTGSISSSGARAVPCGSRNPPTPTFATSS